MDVVIVESPAKAKTINKYLGSGYAVLASYGHVRDLPAKDGSVRPHEDFAMSWEVDGKSKKRLSDIAEAAKGADRLILATDPDREGEAISWHVLDVLRRKRGFKDLPVQRVVFNAITKAAVQQAMASPRDIDTSLVDAYLARRALDYLVGFNLSPILWRKLPGARSAGRVQSVALRLVVERELEVERFEPREYWSILTDVETPRGDVYEARIARADGRTLKRLDIGDEATASELADRIRRGDFTVTSVEAKPTGRNPSPPFTTSTLQQEASRKLGFSATRTMQTAQRLYEGVTVKGETVGLITYMRTDGTDLSAEALDGLRSLISSSYGERYLPEKARVYKTKAKNAQEAHEAIRPTNPDIRPEDVKLEPDQQRLYELIWKRAVACQMAAARLERTTIDLDAGDIGLRATGSVVTFDGFLRIYEEGRDDGKDEDDKRLPQVVQGEPAKILEVKPAQHFTEPPPRFTEATLVKRMEELGIGRPSTYASILQVLRDRGYVEMDRNRFVPQDKGRLVTAFLETFFERYVEYDFTADLEEKLDRVSAGELDYKDVLRDFWADFSQRIGETQELRIGEVIEALNELLGPYIFLERENGTDPRLCPSCNEGQLSLKLSKYGAFIGCSNYPDCRYTRPFSADGEEVDEALASPEGKLLGTDPETGHSVTLRSGRFGPYVQLDEPGAEKPKRSSLPKGWEASEMDLEAALKLLSLPRDVGVHPESGEPIKAGIGRYGPFLLHDGKYANLETVEDVFTVGINRAVDLIAQKAARGGRGRGGASALKTLGEHPELGGPVTVHEGRFGPYVKNGKINATLPKDVKPEDVTMAQAIDLIAARAEKTGAKKSGAGKSKKSTKAKPKAAAKAS